MSEHERVLDFWFKDAGPDGCCPDETVQSWWKKDPSFDAAIRDQFASDYAAIVNDEREDWLSTPRGGLAYVIVLDQFSRNMFRDSEKMYAADERALRVVKDALARGFDRQLPGDLRAFFYLPLMHSESLADQEECIRQFEQFAAESEGALKDRLTQNVKYAVAHRDIVAEWGRFPHRNAILGRASTPEEEAFLQKPGSSF